MYTAIRSERYLLLLVAVGQASVSVVYRPLGNKVTFRPNGLYYRPNSLYRPMV